MESAFQIDNYNIIIVLIIKIIIILQRWRVSADDDAAPASGVGGVCKSKLN